MWDSCYKMRQKAVIWKLLQSVTKVYCNVRPGITKYDKLLL